MGRLTNVNAFCFLFPPLLCLCLLYMKFLVSCLSYFSCLLKVLPYICFIKLVCMDRNAPDYYLETTDSSLSDTEAFVRHTLGLEYEGKEAEVTTTAGSSPLLVTPVVTPRFVPTCTVELLQGLGKISSMYQIPVQSHLSESPQEIAWVKELHPECSSYSDVYRRYGLMHERSYFAHCVHSCGEERAMMLDTKAGVVHCASSNMMLSSGVCNVRRFLDEGIKVGLGTDVAGGYSTSMLDCIRKTLIVSRVSCMGVKHDEGGEGGEPISFQEAFHLATQGGAETLGLGEVVGNFLPGKQFDAIVVDPTADRGEGHGSSPYDLFPELGQGMQAAFEKFLFLGDDRNIWEVFVAGKKVV
ncbi:unnamed protein product [Choristocarpus tenellus]